MATRQQSVIGPTSRVRGQVRGEGALRIEGEVDGDIAVGGAAEIAQGGSVRGDVEAESLDVAGTLTGDVRAEGLVVVREGAELAGGVQATRIAIEPGARVSLRLDMKVTIGG